MGVTGQLSFWDAAAYQQSRLGDPVDWFAFWVFEGVPDRAAVEAQLSARLPAIALLRRRIAELPGHLDRPYWVVDDSPLADHLLHHDGESLDWSACMDRIGQYFPHQLDGRRTSWQLHVFYDVRNCPHTDGPATVVVAQLSHAMTTGMAMDPLTDALFGTGRPVAVLGLPEARTQPLSRVRALGRSARAPFRALSLVIRVATSKSNKKVPTPAKPPEMVRPDIARPPEPVAADRGPRTIRFVQVPTAQVKGESVTVTAGVLAAISGAMQDYVESVSGLRSAQITSNVVVSVPEAELMGVNRLSYEILNLRGDLETLGDRARAIAAALRASRERPVKQSTAGVQATVPFMVYRLAARLGRRRAKAVSFLFDQRLYTALTSLIVKSDAELAGFPVRLMSVYQGGSLGLTHSLCGSPETVTVGVVAQSGVIADIDAYASYLKNALATLGETLH